VALLQTYGANGWRIQNYLLESTAKQTEKALEELKELTVEINRDRKNAQVHHRHSLCSLGASF
jgi:pre-mRNA-splicing factor SPF27